MKLFCLLLCMFACHFSFAQPVDELIKTQNGKPFIEVTGTAIKEAIPDKIFITITLSDKVVNSQPYTITTQEDKLKQALTKINIPLSNLSLSDASSEITTYKSKETGFKVIKEYTLLVSDATQVSDVFRELYAVNIKEASIAKADRSDIEALRKEVRIAAIKAAKDKADYLVTAIGENLGKPLEIHEEQNIPFFQSQLLENTVLTRSGSGTASESEATNFRRFTIKFSYYIKYEIR